jgi:hypothetical protein
MTVKVLPKPGFLTLKKHPAHSKQERLETFQLQEQFSGAIPLRTERPAAELLAERLAESDPASACPVFIP